MIADVGLLLYIRFIELSIIILNIYKCMNISIAMTYNKDFVDFLMSIKMVHCRPN